MALPSTGILVLLAAPSFRLNGDSWSLLHPILYHIAGGTRICQSIDRYSVWCVHIISAALASIAEDEVYPRHGFLVLHVCCLVNESI